MTQPEQQAQDLTSRLQSLNEALVGQSQYQAEQEQKFGIGELQKTQNDLSSQLKGLQNEALAIPISIQQDFQGRGATAGGVQPIQTARLRENAIRALSVSSLLEASRGNLALAIQQVDRAVSQKFDPIKEQIAVKMANLDLILKSPAYSLADKNRAERQKTIQDKKARDVARQESNYQIAQAMAAATVKLNPNDQAALIAAQRVQQLDVADSNYLMKVYELVGRYQTDPAKIQQDLLDMQYKAAQIDAINADTSLTPLKKQQLITQIEATRTTTQLAVAKFNEDIRQFDLEYALKQIKQQADVKAAQIASQGADTLKINALATARQLLTDFTNGKGTSAVGGNIQNRLGVIGDWVGKGTGRADFIVNFNNLKSLLSLDNVKYLKGQGQVSDAERRLLEEASAKLDRSQSETEFKSALGDIVEALSGGTFGDTQIVNGVTYKKAADGLYYPQ